MNPYLTLAAPNASAASDAPAPQGGNIVHNRRIRVDEQTAHIHLPGSAATNEPRVEMVREGGVVRSIIVRCACGCATQLVCEYE